MKPIKFSHIYPKLLDSLNDVIEQAQLLEVIPVRLESLSADFIDYDTNKGAYPLPKRGDYLMLVFLKPHEDYFSDTNLFTTIRRNISWKEEYYRGLIGEWFTVEITNLSTPLKEK